MSDTQHLRMGGFKPEPDDPKHRDFNVLKPRLKAAFGGVIDLRPFTSPRHNQRWSSTCVAQSVVKALEIKRIMKHGHENHVDLSVLAVYYLARELMFPPQTHIDDGTHVSHACDVLRRFGVPAEEAWPFSLEEDRINMSPSWSAMRRAYQHKIASFYRIRSSGPERVEDVVDALRSGNPVVFGAVTNPAWHGYKAGDILVPSADKGGGHATVLVGWDGTHFIGENSWGTNWGDDGFYLMDPGYIESAEHASDFWVLQAGWEVT